MDIRAFVVLVAALCASCAQPPRDAVRGQDSFAALEADTEMACARSHRRDAGMWTQLMFFTRTWRDLALRADRRDPGAWEEIGNLIERNRHHVDHTSCTDETLSAIRGTAARLRGAH
ncbi:hypothetical protein LZC95_26950 [Pendulispora brunnea]|uniref:Uncharacterized protein n=1 Tax=Pendulispora brunnea TaxID=2905690 RepID=A0ABZ2JUN3_9BACT